MEPILSARGQATLGRFVTAPVLLAFDFDGTLAPIVSAPDAARARPSTLGLLKTVARLYPLAVISGRSTSDLQARFAGTGIEALVGNHGLDLAGANPEAEACVRRFAALLEATLAGEAGVVVEEKGLSLCVHYRNAPDRRRAAQRVRRATAGLVGARLIGGKLGVNVLPDVEHDKGTALEALMRSFECQRALYAGDCVTDEDVFIRTDPGRLLSIRVGRSAGSRAAYYIPRQRDIDRLLMLLVKLRAGSSTAARAPG